MNVERPAESHWNIRWKVGEGTGIHNMVRSQLITDTSRLYFYHRIPDDRNYHDVPHRVNKKEDTYYNRIFGHNPPEQIM